MITNPAYTFSTYDAFSRIRSGSPVPNFRYRISHLIDASGVYSVDATRTSYGYGEIYTEWTNVSCKTRNSDTATGLLDVVTFGGFADFTASISAARSTAEGGFWSSASALESQGLTFLGELHQTIRMLRNPFQGVRNLVDDYISSVRKNARSIRRMSPRQAARYLGSQYLELSFGINPLVQDCKSIIASAIRLQDEVQVVPLRSYGKREVSTVAAPVIVSLANYGRLVRYQTTKQKVSVTCRGAYKLSRYSDAPLEAIADNFGLFPSGFAPTIWELLPYSWLVDYFSNIGGILAAASVCRGNIAWSNTAQVVEEVHTCTYGPGVNTTLTGHPLRGFQTGTHSPSTKERYRFNRSVGVGVPDFQVSLPGLNQSLNIAALIAQWRSTSRLLT